MKTKEEFNEYVVSLGRVAEMVEDEQSRLTISQALVTLAEGGTILMRGSTKMENKILRLYQDGTVPETQVSYDLPEPTDKFKNKRYWTRQDISINGLVNHKLFKVSKVYDPFNRPKFSTDDVVKFTTESGSIDASVVKEVWIVSSIQGAIGSSKVGIDFVVGGFKSPDSEYWYQLEHLPGVFYSESELIEVSCS